MVTTPLLVLPHLAAQYAAGILCTLAVLAALWVVGLRDPWCYAIALFSAPLTLVSATVGNPTAVITLLVALSYRFGSAPAGIAVAVKLYPWPMLLWGLLTRGRRDLAVGVLVTLAAVLVPWALIGFDGIEHYLTVSRTITDQARQDSGVLSPPVQVASHDGGARGHVGTPRQARRLFRVRHPRDARRESRAVGVLPRHGARPVGNPAPANFTDVASAPRPLGLWLLRTIGRHVRAARMVRPRCPFAPASGCSDATLLSAAQRVRVGH